MMELFIVSGIYIRLGICVKSNILKKICTPKNLNKFYDSTRWYSVIMTQKTPFQRLPTDVVPSIYDIFIEPNLKAFTFKGEEKIQIKVCISILATLF